MSQSNNADKPAARFLSRSECDNVVKKVRGFANGKGVTAAVINAYWQGNVRWGRNEIISCGDVRNNTVQVRRTINGASNIQISRELSDKSLQWAVTKAERLLQFKIERPEDALISSYIEPYELPKIWFESTFNLLAKDRADIIAGLVKTIEDNRLVSAGYIQVSGEGRSIDIHDLNPIYIPQTRAELSITVRDTKGLGSGWAGIDWNDWTRIDGRQLTEIAIEKCLRSRNPVRIEPGRYNVVLEPQAVHDISQICFGQKLLSRGHAESGGGPYAGAQRGSSKIGLRLFDERLTVVMDPMDPKCSLSPVFEWGDVLNRAVWVENGVLKNLAFGRPYGITQLGINSGLPTTGSYSMSGGEATVDEMIERTERGLLVTRFSNIGAVDEKSVLLNGYTRDGLWFIERGKITKSVKNMRFTESPFHTLNNIIELGVPQRVFSPSAPAVVPAIMSRDFSFTATIDAI